MNWSHTSRGKKLFLEDPVDDDLDLEEIARSLGFTCRYAGCVKVFYSTAEHSVLIAMHLLDTTGNPLIAMGGLLHDAHEAYTGDITWPMQSVIFGSDGSGERAKERHDSVKNGLDEVIGRMCGIPHSMMKHPMVKEADLRILLTERDALLDGDTGKWYPERVGMSPLPVKIHGYGPVQAGILWLGTYNLLRNMMMIVKGSRIRAVSGPYIGSCGVVTMVSEGRRSVRVRLDTSPNEVEIMMHDITIVP